MNHGIVFLATTQISQSFFFDERARIQLVFFYLTAQCYTELATITKA